MPISISTPISDMTLRVVCVSGRMISTPMKPMGIASMIRNGSINDRNCAIRIRNSRMNDMPNPIGEALEGLRSCRPPCRGGHADIRRQLGICDGLLDRGAQFAQILARRRDVDVDHALNLVVIDFRRRLEIFQLHDGIERGGLLQIRRPQRNLLQVDQVVDGGTCRARRTARVRK